MTSLPIIFVILIVTAGLVLAGCVGQAENGKITGNVPTTVLITSSIPAPTHIEPSQVPQEDYWIKINPIGDKHVGDIFTITSTTNLTVGRDILVQVYSSNFHPGIKMQTREFSGATGTVRVIQGMKGINTISFAVDSSTLYSSSPLKPDKYIVTEVSVIQPVIGTAFFNVLPAPEGTPRDGSGT
jgi:hypothetical protein